MTNGTFHSVNYPGVKLVEGEIKQSNRLRVLLHTLRDTTSRGQISSTLCLCREYQSLNKDLDSETQIEGQD